LLAAWVALALLTQALAVGATAMGRAHRHAAQRANVVSAWLWQHARSEPAREPSADAHADAHAQALPHHHAATDTTVLPGGPDAAAEAAVLAALIAVPVLRGPHPFVLADLDHVWAALPPWAATAHTVRPPRRPPRA
jgi:hypothetical protein